MSRREDYNIAFQKVLASLMLVLIMNFTFSNAIFMHHHIGSDGRWVMHSHPFCASHSHSQSGLDQVASFNVAAQGFNAVGQISIDNHLYAEKCTYGDICAEEISGRYSVVSLRGPPELL